MSLWFVAAHLALPGGFVASTPLHHYDDSIASSSIFGSTALEAKPVLLHELGTQTMSNRVAAFEQAMRQAKFHAPTVSAQDPFRFKHRQQHHDTESDKLTYFEYSARRHGHVLMLNDTDFQRCFLQVSENEITSISLELSTATYSKINITSGTILLGDINCRFEGKPWTRSLRERVVAQPIVKSGAHATTVNMTLYTQPAGFHECFEHAHIEFYHGSPQSFRAARLARESSLLSNGHAVPYEGFAESPHVIADAMAHDASQALSIVRSAESSEDFSSSRSAASRNLVETCSDPPDWPKQDISIELEGTDCTDLTAGSAMEDPSCFWKSNSSSRHVGLKAGNRYTLRWASATVSDPDVKIYISKEDPGESKTHCVDLHSQISNQVYSGLASSSPNSLTFEMPDLGVLQCVNDSLSLLEFQLVVSTIDDCHIKALDFQLLVKEENDSQSFSLNVPAELELGDESKGLRVECKDCYARGTGDVHVLVRTSSGNPFEETWTWGSVSLNAIVDVDIQAYVTSLQSIRSFLVSDRQGIPGLFMNANVAGVGIILGMLAELRVHAEGHFSSPATLPYQSQMGASGTFEHHTRQGLTLQKFLGDFDPTAQQESPAAPQQEIDIDASATVWIIPKMFAGVFTSASASSQAEAYIAFEVQMALSAHFKIRNAPSADGARLGPIDHSSQCTTAIHGCSTLCSEDHAVSLAFEMSAVTFGYNRFYINALFPIMGNVNLGSPAEVGFEESPFSARIKKIGSFCFNLDPESQAIPYPETGTPAPPPSQLSQLSSVSSPPDTTAASPRDSTSISSPGSTTSLPTPSPPQSTSSPDSTSISPPDTTSISPPGPTASSPSPSLPELVSPVSASTSPSGECTCPQLAAFISSGVGSDLCDVARLKCTNSFSLWQCYMSTTDGVTAYTLNCMTSSSSESPSTDARVTGTFSDGVLSSIAGGTGICEAPEGSFCCDDDPSNPRYVCIAGSSCGRGICVPAGSTLCGCEGRHYCAAGTTCCGNTCCADSEFCGGDENSCTCTSNTFPSPRVDLACGPTAVTSCGTFKPSSPTSWDSSTTSVAIIVIGVAVVLIIAILSCACSLKKRGAMRQHLIPSAANRLEIRSPRSVPNTEKDKALTI